MFKLLDTLPLTAMGLDNIPAWFLRIGGLKLFNDMLHYDKHLLRSLLPPKRNQQYSVRNRRHSLQLPIRTSALNSNNFLTRMIFKEL